MVKKKQASMSLQNRRTDAFIMLHHTVRSWIIIRAQLKLLWGTDGKLAKMRDRNRVRLEEKRTWSSADSRETIIIIFCHLFGKLQILLLPFSSLLSTHAEICQQAVSAELLCTVTVCPSHLSRLQILVVRLGWESHGLHRNGWILLTALKWTVADHTHIRLPVQFNRKASQTYTQLF